MSTPREIKFRVMDAQGDWFYFKLPKDNDELYLYSDNKHETLMQYTGLHDKNNKEIYESDLLRHTELTSSPPREVKWYRGSFGLRFDWGFDGLYERAENSESISCYEIIGNRFENPELLK